MLVSSKELFNLALKNKFAIPATNFMNRSTVKSYIAASEKLNVPTIIQFAQAHNEVMDLEEAAILGRYYAEKASTPVVLHLDHGEDIEFVKRAVDLGFSSVMIDASTDELEENIKKTKEIVEYAHHKNVVVEAEIGHVGSGENYENQEESDSVYTEVNDAILFTKETDVDSLAISIGTAHGNYTKQPKINFERLKEIHQAIPTPLVLHGGSSTGDEKLKKCTDHGIVKINIFTDIINNAISTIDGYDGNYIDLELQMEEKMTECVMHYMKVFRTERYAN